MIAAVLSFFFFRMNYWPLNDGHCVRDNLLKAPEHGKNGRVPKSLCDMLKVSALCRLRD